MVSGMNFRTIKAMIRRETDRRMEENICILPYGTVNKYGHDEIVRTNS